MTDCPKSPSLKQPIGSMYGIFTYIDPIKKSTIHVGKYISPMDGMGTEK